jgi:SPP1 gp7 family putative phage head morphogenesis protein
VPTVNEQLADAAIGHAVDLSRYSNGAVRRIIALLNRTDADLFGQLGAALSQMTPEAFTVEWLEQVLSGVRRLNLSAYQQIERELTTELQALAAYEAQYQYQLFRTTLPPQVVNLIGVATVSAETAYAAAMARPFQGVLLREWAQRAGEARMIRIRDALRMGFVEGQTVDQMVRRLRGTRAAGFADGLIEIDRRNAAAVVRTAVQHTAATVRDRFHEENGDIIKAIEWVSTLDSRTTPECMLRDGKQYTRDHKPIGHKLPWGAGPGRFHWQCRSTSVAITKSWRELGLDMDEMDPGTRASMDGQVPAQTTYADWIKKQSAARQDEILGPARGKLLREGGLTLDRFADDRGKWISLDQLRERDAAAFRRAGV